MRTYKLVIIGDGGVGKTTFIRRVLGDPFHPSYIATIGVDVRPFDFGGVTFNIWDCAGQEKFMGLAEGYFIQADCAIVMCDHHESSIKNAATWIRKFKSVPGNENKPIEMVYNKCDVKPREGVVNTSTRYNTNTLDVFNNLLAKLTTN
jgi:GTP-binding nuclear protein Ran